MKKILIAFIVLVPLKTLAQNANYSEFPSGRVSLKDLDIKSYPADSSAGAVVLDERGSAFIDLENGGHLIFERYLKIKILTKNGFSEADFAIPLYKTDKYKERMDWVIASTFNYQGTSIKETKLDDKKKFVQNFRNYDLQKFSLPEIREGSVIEVKYKIISDFIGNFRTWEFQADIPKVHSEYTAKIPANYIYNITLRGFLKMDVNESSVLKDCAVGGLGEKASCNVMHFAMENVPAFKEEQYMTAKDNFLSALHFELSSITDFSGNVAKYTESWSDVDIQLNKEQRFGQQIKKAADVLSEKVTAATAGETDDLAKAKKIYGFVTSWYTWNGDNGMYTDAGVAKAFELKKGNCGDINLSLVGALQKAELKAYPVILSTRDNGLASEIYPVRTEFNYVVAAVDVGGTRYLLDATSDLLPFGVLPTRCLNGRGRLIDKESSFIDLKPVQKFKTVTSMEVALADDGHIEGKVTITSQGYDALSKRSQLLAAEKREAYVEGLQKDWKNIELSNYSVENLEDVSKPLIEKADVKVEPGSATTTETIYVNPFLAEKTEKNPFTSNERSYPIDYGAPVENLYVISLSFPASWRIDELPKSVGLALPQAGGKYTFNATQAENKLSIVSNQTLTRQVYNPGEYHFLKELYARIIQIEQSQVVFKKK